MYRFVDQMPASLAEHHHFLVGALREWTAAARGGRCTCAALAPGFGWRGVMPALPDFTTAMAVLDQHATRGLRFGGRGGERVTDDEAAVLALFSAALDGDALVTRRIAAALLADTTPAVATEQLAAAAEWVALRFVQAPMVRRD